MLLVNPQKWAAVRESQFVWDRQIAEHAQAWADAMEESFQNVGFEFTDELVWGSFEETGRRLGGPQAYRQAIRLLAENWVHGEQLARWVQQTTGGRHGVIREGKFIPREEPFPPVDVFKRRSFAAGV